MFILFLMPLTMAAIPDYLDKSYDYSKLTKQQLIRILTEHNIDNLPNLHARKAEILECYRTHIYDRIDEILNVNYKKSKSVEHTPEKKRSIEKVEQSHRKKDFDLSSTGETDKKIFEKKTLDRTPEKKLTKLNSVENTPQKNVARKEGDSSAIRFLSPLVSKLKRASLDPVLVTPKKIPKITGDISKLGHFQKRKSGHFRFYFRFISVIFILVLIYMKFLCPYCKEPTKTRQIISNPTRLCINVPEHSIYKNGIVCDVGYSLESNLILPNKCVVDKTEETIRDMIMRKAVIKLRKRNMEYIYGLSSSNYIKKKDINLFCRNLYSEYFNANEESIVQRNKSSKRYSRKIPREDELIANIIEFYPDIRDNGVALFSVSDSFILSIFLKYLFFRFISYFIVPVFVIIALILMRNRRKAKKIQKAEHKKYIDSVLKEISDALINHRILSIKSSHVPVYLVVKQVRDYLDCLYWEEVRTRVRKNSNINEYNVGSDEVWEWIGPIMGVRDLN